MSGGERRAARSTTHVRGAVLALVAVLSSLALAGPASAAESGTIQGCKRGWVCVYPEDKGWNGGHPSLHWSAYGPHNLSEQYGAHMVFNNQYKDGGHWPFAYLCNGYDGRQPDGGFFAHGQDAKRSYGVVDLSSVNSILLK